LERVWALPEEFRESLKRASLEAVEGLNKVFKEVEEANRGRDKSEWDSEYLKRICRVFTDAMRRRIDPDALCYKAGYEYSGEWGGILVTCRLPSKKMDVVMRAPVEKLYLVIDDESEDLEWEPYLYSLELGKDVRVWDVIYY
jgi:hypothetical protein